MDFNLISKLWKKLTSNALLGANELIGAIGAPLGDYFLGNIHGIFSKKFSKKKIKNLLKTFCIILLRIMLKICHKYVIFKVLQVLLHYF
jgi:hypothetical protein